MPGFLLIIPTFSLLFRLFDEHATLRLLLGLYPLLGGRAARLLLLLHRLDLVHVGDGGLKLGVRPELFLCYTEQLSDVHCFARVTIYNLEEALSGDSVIFRRVIPLAFVPLHLPTNVIEFGLACRFRVPIGARVPLAFTKSAKELFHLAMIA